MLALVARLRVPRLPAVQPAPAGAAPPSSWATPAARCSASRSRASGSRRAGPRPGTTVATVFLPLIVLAIPILDTTLVTVVRLVERPPGDAGREGSHVSPARLLRPLGAGARGAARDRRGRARRDGARLQRARQLAGDVDRGPRQRRAARPVRQLPHRDAGASEEHAAPPVAACLAALAAPGDRDRRRLRAHVRLVPRRVRDRRRRARHRGTSGRAFSPRSRSCWARGTSASSLGGVYRRVWRYAATADELVVAPSHASVSAVLSWLIVASVRGYRVPGVGVRLDAVFAFVLVGGSRLAFRGLRRVAGRPLGEGDALAGTRRRRGEAREELRARGAGDAGAADRRVPRRQPGPPRAADRGPACARRRSPMSSARSRESGATEVVVTIADAPNERLDDSSAPAARRQGYPAPSCDGAWSPCSSPPGPPQSEPSVAPARAAGVDPSASPLRRHGSARDLAGDRHPTPTIFSDELEMTPARPVARGHGSCHAATGCRPEGSCRSAPT